VIAVNAKLLVDNKEIGLNEFVEKFLSGMVAGCCDVSARSKRGMEENRDNSGEIKQN